MLHFTPFIRPLEGHMRGVYGRGDIGVRALSDQFISKA
jgi:hypothetical protein